MAPQKGIRDAATNAALLPLARKGISTRSQTTRDQNIDPNLKRGKRKADNSPLKNEKVKRSALGNLTNNVNNMHIEEEKKNILAKTDINVCKKTVVNILKQKNENAIGPPSGVAGRVKILTRAASKNANAQLLDQTQQHAQQLKPHPPMQVDVAKASVHSVQSVHPPKVQQQPVTTVVKTKESLDAPKPATRRISNEFEKSEESLYMSALEDITLSDNSRLSGAFDSKRRSLLRTEQRQTSIEEEAETQIDKLVKSQQHEVPEGVVDFDKETLNDPFQVGEYAMDIFNYLKERENEFIIEDYMDKQIYLSKWMRSLLIDWMVEVQETFELNHETLYLAVKLVDIYLGKEVVMKDKLQLLGAAALFIACKFDERTPPLVEDFLYICDGAYNHNELIKMEMNVLKIIDYDLGIPLSYRFLRRYARCAKVPMPTLTLARFILEFSLMDYATISFRDSQLACAALFIALKMNGLENPWSTTLEYYTGYRLEDFAFMITILNAGLHRKPKESTKTIRNKYSHKIFYEVAKIPVLSVDKLFENTGLLDGTTNRN